MHGMRNARRIVRQVVGRTDSRNVGRRGRTRPQHRFRNESRNRSESRRELHAARLPLLHRYGRTAGERTGAQIYGTRRRTSMHLADERFVLDFRRGGRQGGCLFREEVLQGRKGFRNRSSENRDNRCGMHDAEHLGSDVVRKFGRIEIHRRLLYIRMRDRRVRPRGSGIGQGSDAEIRKRPHGILHDARGLHDAMLVFLRNRR